MISTEIDHWCDVLRREFDAEDGSFVGVAQSECRWDKEAFRELVEAMRDCCVCCSEDDQFDRWMAHGFFYVPAFVRLWSQQPGFQRPGSAYLRQSNEMLENLSHWFFWGEPPTELSEIGPLMLD